MKKETLSFLVSLLLFFSAQAQSGYKIGDRVGDFTLTNVVTKSSFSLNAMQDKKAVVLVFTSHNCPYSKIYEQRAKAFIQEFEQKGVAFILINPNNPSIESEDSPEAMAEAAKQRGYLSPYLADAAQSVANLYGATKMPEVFVLKNQSGAFTLKYKGAIDDNPQVASDVSSSYLRDALESVLLNQPVKISEKKATGCMIHR